jgi:Protein of unknown function (DUF3606)
MTGTIGSHPAAHQAPAPAQPPLAKVTDPPATIDVRDGEATDYWAYRLGVSSDELFAAIDQVGSSVAAVRRHLHK